MLALLEFCEKFQSFEVTICPASINHVTNTIEVKHTRFRLIEVLVPSRQFIVRFLISSFSKGHISSVVPKFTSFSESGVDGLDKAFADQGAINFAWDQLNFSLSQRVFLA